MTVMYKPYLKDLIIIFFSTLLVAFLQEFKTERGAFMLHLHSCLLLAHVPYFQADKGISA
jgi:hypothetical protein